MQNHAQKRKTIEKGKEKENHNIWSQSNNVKMMSNMERSLIVRGIKQLILSNLNQWHFKANVKEC